jgi:hypothetical protein
MDDFFFGFIILCGWLGFVEAARFRLNNKQTAALWFGLTPEMERGSREWILGIWHLKSALQEKDMQPVFKFKHRACV